MTLGEKWTVVIWKLKKGTDLIFSSGWRGRGMGEKADLWMKKGVEAMKTEEINQRYHLHGSLVNHRPQRFISLWGSSCCSCCHNKPNPPNHHAYCFHTKTHTQVTRMIYKPFTFRQALCHQKCHLVVSVCRFKSNSRLYVQKCNLSAYSNITCIWMIYCSLCVQKRKIKS